MSPAPTERVLIRPLEAPDLAAIAALERQIFPSPWRAADFGGFLRLPAGLGRVAVRADAVIGYAVGWVASDEAELANVAVAGEARRRGVGRTLLEAFLAAAAARGARSLWLEVRAGDAGAQAF
ncbi:MAG: GNAT family N-acetyltransferase [Gemmatimonadota bacterium]